MLLVEPDYPVDERLAAVLAEAGVRIGDGVIVDPADHYFTDEQMIAVTRYASHPITRGAGAVVLSRRAAGRAGAGATAARDGAVLDAARRATSSATGCARQRGGGRGADAVRSRWPWRPRGGLQRRRSAVPADRGRRRRFRQQLVLSLSGECRHRCSAGISWLMREERAPVVKPPVEVLPTVALTGAQVRGIFILTVLLLPGAVALTGFGVWLWRRR